MLVFGLMPKVSELISASPVKLLLEIISKNYFQSRTTSTMKRKLFFSKNKSINLKPQINFSIYDLKKW